MHHPTLQGPLWNALGGARTMEQGLSDFVAGLRERESESGELEAWEPILGDVRELLHRMRTNLGTTEREFFDRVVTRATERGRSEP